MPPLHQVLASQSADVLQRWTTQVRQEEPDPTISSSELVDHVPRFLDELVSVLRDVVALKGEVDLKREVAVLAASATEHGSQRFRLGFDIDTVVREYGLLHTCILEMASDQHVAITLDEHRTLVEAINEGIVDAANQYTRQRDIELARRSGEHFAFVAHELRNPLGSAELAFASLSKKGLLPDNPMTKLLGRGLRRAKELIENTLSLMLAGQMSDLRRTKVKLSELVQDAVHEAEPAATDKQITVTIEAKTDPVIDVDERLMRSALNNLVGNAVKFTRTGGTVHIHSFEDGGRAIVEVEDSCGGLPPDAAEKMFSPFVQVGDNRTGFGLGLAIARQALQAHGGNISVRDRPGHGCTFVVEVPAATGG